MEFDPRNTIVRLCLQGMEMEDKGQFVEGNNLFLQAWKKANNDFEKYLAAFFVARHQRDSREKLKWFETALQFAVKADNESAKTAFPTLYSNIARCYEALNDKESAENNHAFANSFADQVADKGPFYHGTKADLGPGDLLTAGSKSNYDASITMNHIYFTALVNGAGLAASLAKGDGTDRVYVVEPTGSFENDPNVTDKKFPGNPTRSYRSEAPLKIVGEIKDWAKQTPEDLKKWREKLANTNGKIIN